MQSLFCLLPDADPATAPWFIAFGFAAGFLACMAFGAGIGRLALMLVQPASPVEKLVRRRAG